MTTKLLRPKPSFRAIKTKRRANGSALMIALFVIVVMALLGAAILNMQRTSSESIAQEVLGTRALAAARTGMQIQLQKLFPLKAVSGNCPNTTYIYDLAAIAGLPNCQAAASCTNYATHDGIAYYRLVSTSTCGSGDMKSDSSNIVLSSRTIQVEARRL
ncbi:MAG: hypothetical protein ACSHW0_01230 [Thalassotalea sp.]